MLSATVAALSQSPIHRLKRTWEQVPQRTMNSFEELQALMSVNQELGRIQRDPPLGQSTLRTLCRHVPHRLGNDPGWKPGFLEEVWTSHQLL